MKITKHGITITDVPGVESIVVENGAAEITFTDRVTSFYAFPLPMLKELRDALSAAIRELEGGSGVAPVRPDGPWDRVEEIPDDVNRVLDCEGDFWRRNSNTVSGWTCGSWGNIHVYAPFARA